MKILIAGCGDLGTALGVALATAGDEVYGLRRQAGRLPAPLRPLAADLGAPETIRDLPAVEAVILSLIHI